MLRFVCSCLTIVLFAGIAGCHYAANYDPTGMAAWFGGLEGGGPALGPTHPPGVGTANPLRISGVDREFLWNQLVDTVDDYFRIDHENRVQIIGGVVTEGQIETHYLPGATALEPWRWDSASDFELTHASLQSIRRRAKIRVVPCSTGFDVHVAVFKELEDVNYPAQATPGSASPRHDVSLARTDRAPLPAQRTLGWIPQGRDFALEQEILRELYARVYDSTGP